jgi:hypothetical protein
MRCGRRGGCRPGPRPRRVVRVVRCRGDDGGRRDGDGGDAARWRAQRGEGELGATAGEQGLQPAEPDERREDEPARAPRARRLPLATRGTAAQVSARRPGAAAATVSGAQQLADRRAVGTARLAVGPEAGPRLADRLAGGRGGAAEHAGDLAVLEAGGLAQHDRLAGLRWQRLEVGDELGERLARDGVCLRVIGGDLRAAQLRDLAPAPQRHQRLGPGDREQPRARVGVRLARRGQRAQGGVLQRVARGVLVAQDRAAERQQPPLVPDVDIEGRRVEHVGRTTRPSRPR